ncbi:MAG: sugar ABC transporter permease [Truepera sp.]|jgi:multiple sugar transport system permease protein|nr:sugar ABC transporter permease [Truepera sp.]
MRTLRRIFGPQPSAWLFLLPGLALFTIFLVIPLLYSARISFYDWNIIDPSRSTFLGFGNYARAIADPIFRRAVVNTIVYALVTVPLQLVLALLAAVLLNVRVPGRTFFRVATYLPVITSWVIVTLVFEYLFNSQAGLVNYVLVDVLHLVASPVRWLADPILAMVPLHLLGIWKGVGWSAIILLAALQSVPRNIYEAAEVDGVGPAQTFRYITLPLLRPTLVFLLVVLVIGALNVYISGLLLTNGGNPMGLTHFVLTLMYQKTFTNLEFGYGSSISYMLAAFIFVISVVQIRLLRRRTEY